MSRPLASRLAEGREEAFAELYDAHAEPLYRYLLARVRTAHAAEDLLQAVFLRLVKYRSALAGVTNLRAYLFSAARNELVRRAGKWREPREDGADLLSALAAPDTDSAGDLEALQAAVDDLAPERREVVILKVAEGHTFAEVGELLEISPNTAASRYRYALLDLRKKLERADEPR